jgi:hypothetical protein
MHSLNNYSKVSENIRLEKAGSKNWWTLVKRLTGNNECSRTIPPIEHNGNLVLDDIEKAELFLFSPKEGRFILVCEILDIFVSSVFNFGHFWFPCV